MPRAKGQKEGLSTWFRAYYRTDRGNLKKDNDVVRRAWEEAHPGEEWSPKLAQAMANVKSSEKHRRRKGGRPAKGAEGGDSAPRAARAHATPSLDALELAIDDCLTSARLHGHKDEEMEKVIKHLRLARNNVVLIQGKP